MTRDGARTAAASIDGTIALVDRKMRTVQRIVTGSGAPVWAVAFLPEGGTLLSGAADHTIRRWSAATGEPLDPPRGAEDPLAAYAREPGAEVFRACVACHALAPDQGNRAGPSLHGIIGRRIASLRVTIIPRRSSISTSYGRRRRWRSCSRSALPSIRRAPKCRNSASARPKIARR
jgi:cytochrome c